MNRRQAKKVVRILRENFWRRSRYRWPTIRAANRKISRESVRRYAATRGAVRMYNSRWRWGKWDPSRPTPLGELPF